MNRRVAEAVGGVTRPAATPPVSGIAGAGSAGRRSGLPSRRPTGTARTQSRVSTPIRAGSAGARSEDAHIGKGGRAEDLETQHRDATPGSGDARTMFAPGNCASSRDWRS
jgi:hypothetical protein